MGVGFAESLPVYNPDESPICVKCRGTDIGLTYCTKSRYADLCYGTAFSETDHFHRRCARCRFEWLELTLDNGNWASLLMNE